MVVMMAMRLGRSVSPLRTEAAAAAPKNERRLRFPLNSCIRLRPLESRFTAGLISNCQMGSIQLRPAGIQTVDAGGGQARSQQRSFNRVRCFAGQEHLLGVVHQRTEEVR